MNLPRVHFKKWVLGTFLKMELQAAILALEAMTVAKLSSIDLKDFNSNFWSRSRSILTGQISHLFPLLSSFQYSWHKINLFYGFELQVSGFGAPALPFEPQPLPVVACQIASSIQLTNVRKKFCTAFYAVFFNWPRFLSQMCYFVCTIKYIELLCLRSERWQSRRCDAAFEFS